jgi:hypothetical protein
MNRELLAELVDECDLAIHLAAGGRPVAKQSRKVRMRWVLFLSGLSVMALVFLSVPTFADAIGYTVVSTFDAQTWTWTFTLPQNPTPDQVGPDEFELLSVPVSMNGAAPVPYFFEFADTGAPNGGGWMGFQCQPVTACGWDLTEGLTFGATLFTGSMSDPVMLTGTFTSTISFPYGSPSSYPTLTASNMAEPNILAMLAVLLGTLLLIHPPLVQDRPIPSVQKRDSSPGAD